MPDPSLAHANRLLDESARLTTGEATRFLFDHYRCARPEMQDAIVLALVAAMLTTRAMRATAISSNPSAVSGASS